MNTHSGSTSGDAYRADFDTLRALAGEDARDIRAAERARADPVRYPAAVADAMPAGISAVAAWRRHRGTSQAQLAAAANLSKTAIARMETKRRGKFGYGRRATREAVAKALDIPLAALDPIEE